AFGHLSVPLPHRGTERGIQLAQAVAIDLHGTRQRGALYRGTERHFLELDFTGALQVAEIFRRVAVDLECGEERDIEVARSEAERRAFVMPEDRHDVVRAHRLLRAAHSGGTVVIS